MYGKLGTHLLRICGVLKVLKATIQLIKNFPDVSINSLTPKFMEIVKSKLVENQSEYINHFTSIDKVNKINGGSVLKPRKHKNRLY